MQNQTITNQFTQHTNDKINGLLLKFMPKIFPALSICVFHRGTNVLQSAWGWIDPETQQIPVRATTLFDLASVSKLFAESAFLSLVSEGKIGLDDKLVDVIPEFATINPRNINGGQDPHSKQHLDTPEEFIGKTVDPTEVTFRHLLTHTSGLPPWRDVYTHISPPAPPTDPDSTPISTRWAPALEALFRYPFVGTIGDTVRYSDIGIMLLGEAIARLHGSTLDQAVNVRICKPLGLESVTYNPVRNGIPQENIVPTEPDLTWRKRRPWGEVHDENACGVGGIVGHAGLFATALDIAKFGQAWVSQDARLGISPDLMQQATSQHASGQFRMGLGWMLKAQAGSSSGDLYSMASYGHTGFTGTSLWIDPQRDLVSAVLTNRVYHGREQEGIHDFRRAIHDVIVEGVEST